MATVKSLRLTIARPSLSSASTRKVSIVAVRYARSVRMLMFWSMPNSLVARPRGSMV
jgi:hypothetical protein